MNSTACVAGLDRGLQVWVFCLFGDGLKLMVWFSEAHVSQFLFKFWFG